MTCWLQGVRGQGLPDSIRKYRQSVFKLNYKIKKHKSVPAAIQDLVSASPTSAHPAISDCAAGQIALLSAASPTESAGTPVEQMLEDPGQMSARELSWSAASGSSGQDLPAARQPGDAMMGGLDAEMGSMGDKGTTVRGGRT